MTPPLDIHIVAKLAALAAAAEHLDHAAEQLSIDCDRLFGQHSRHTTTITTHIDGTSDALALAQLLADATLKLRDQLRTIWEAACPLLPHDA